MTERTANAIYTIWYQVAFGVFLALLCHSITIGLYTRYEAKRALQQIEKEAKKMLQNQAKTARPAPVKAKRPLWENERCIDGTRLYKVQNGWVQIPNDPC